MNSGASMVSTEQRGVKRRERNLFGAQFGEFGEVCAWPEAGGCEVVLELPLRRVRCLQEAAPSAFYSLATSL
jgi:hypothetical protein